MFAARKAMLGGGGPPVTYLGYTQNSGSYSSIALNFSINLPTGYAAGKFVIAVIHCGSASTSTATGTPSAPAGWTTISAPSFASNAGQTLVACRKLDGTEGSSIAFPISASASNKYVVGQILLFSGELLSMSASALATVTLVSGNSTATTASISKYKGWALGVAVITGTSNKNTITTSLSGASAVSATLASASNYAQIRLFLAETTPGATGAVTYTLNASNIAGMGAAITLGFKRK